MSAPPGLGPHCVGRRVVVRRLLRGQDGPSGGPGMTDLLGVMESWSPTSTVVRGEDGRATEIAIADIVSGKPVPPRPSPRRRVSAERACQMSNESWPAVHTEPLGEWLLRASGGFSARANSVMATGDPGLPFEAALARTRAFYVEHDLPAWAQVVVGSPAQHDFERHGWRSARRGEADSEFQLAPVAQAVRAVRRLGAGPLPPVELVPSVTSEWLADDERARTHHEAAVAVLDGPDEVAFATLHRDGALAAKGRVTCNGDWAGVTDIWVSPDHRRQGLATVVLGAMLGWAAERGATTAYLQARGDNAPALALYGTLGFHTHHAYRYLAAPD